MSEVSPAERVPLAPRGGDSPRRVDKVERTDRQLGLSWVENVFFVAVMLLAFGFALILLGEVRWSWSLAVFVAGFWAVMAYLALPRLHRVLTSIYVPNYFFGRTRTTDGLLGDPINLAFVGSEQQLHETMRASGWVQADPVTLGSSWRIVVSSLLRRSYPEAPVSPLVLFGRTQAFSYQQEVEVRPSQRHHVRFWPTPPGWLLPGGYRVDWLASGTFDRAVGLSFFTLQVTHRIDRDIDIERDYIIGSVQAGMPAVSVRVIEDFSTGYHGRNGGGDAVQTDGDLPVVQLQDVAVPDVAAKRYEPTSALDRLGRRPVSVVATFALTLASALLTVGDLFYRWFGLHLDSGSDYLHEVPNAVEPRWVVLGMCCLYVPIIGLAWRTYRGGWFSRLMLAGLVTVKQLAQMGQYLNGSRATVSALLTMCVDLFLVFAVTTLSAREWAAERRGTRHPAVAKREGLQPLP